MTLKTFLLLGTATIVGAASFSSIAFAGGTANATFGAISFGGSGTFQGSAHGSLGSAQAFRYSSTNIVNEVPPLFNGLPNAFASGSTAVPLASPVTFPGNLFNITGTFAGPGNPGGPLGTTITRHIAPYLTFGTATDPTRYNFDLLTITFSEGTTTIGGSVEGTLNYVATGTFVDTLTGGFTTDTALLSFAATQVGTGSSLNYSVTFDTPAPVPEPESLSLLGIGLLGLGAAGTLRRRSKKAA